MDLSQLSVEEQGPVRSLLSRHSSVFSTNDTDLGCTNLISHDIPLIDDTPVTQRYRRIPPSEYEVVKEHINQLLSSQVIRESSSPYASPIFLVRKKDCSVRMCVDYRQLNHKTRKDAFPLPRIEESLDALSGARWFSTLDLASGYHQSRRPIGQRLLFVHLLVCSSGTGCLLGSVTHPALSRGKLQRIFGDQQCQSLLLYLDDIVVFSSTVEQHVERLQVVLERLQHEGLKAKLRQMLFPL